ncbi:MAG: EamA family transporter [Maricaulaceae bacterium]
MSPLLLASVLILLSAFLHVIISALMKGASDKLVYRGLLGFTCASIAAPFAFIVDMPTSQAWVWLAMGAAVHFLYQLSQVASYNRGDLSLVYPIMRGIAPALATLFAFLILQETQSTLTLAGLSIVVISLIGIGWTGQSISALQKSALGFAVFCGVMTALYTVIDAKGIRVSGNRMSYLVWFFIIDGICITALIAFKRGRQLLALNTQDLKRGGIGGVLSLVSFGTALYAFSIAPIAQLAALRETSILFGAILAKIWLKEAFGNQRVLFSALLVTGLILMQF